MGEDVNKQDDGDKDVSVEAVDMPPQEQEVFDRYHGSSQSFRQIADAMGLTESRVSLLLAKATSRVNAKLKTLGYGDDVMK